MTLKNLIVLVFVLAFSQAAFSFSAWDNQNNPKKFASNYIVKFSKLKKAGKLTTLPWSGDYWPTYKGGITYRWAKRENVESRRWNYRLPTLRQLKKMDLSTLSPSEKWDIYNGDLNFGLTKYERKRTGVLVKNNIPKWEGLCHAWAPATVLYKNPKPITVKAPNGLKVPFGSSDIKALLTYHGHLSKSYKTNFLGSRCSLDFKQLEKDYKAGRISKRQLNRSMESKACADTNAGAFHVVLANQIAKRRESFILDITRDAEVWNQAVYSYKTKVLKTKRGASSGAARGTKKEVTVSTSVTYIQEVPQTWKKEINKKAFGRAVYKYRLELNKRGEIIGGAWLSHGRPDFIWKQTKPAWTGFLAKLKKLYNKSK